MSLQMTLARRSVTVGTVRFVPLYTCLIDRILRPSIEILKMLRKEKKFFGTAFGLTTKVPVSSFCYTSESKKPTIHEADNGSGTILHREFCPTCGSGILEVYVFQNNSNRCAPELLSWRQILLFRLMLWSVRLTSGRYPEVPLR